MLELASLTAHASVTVSVVTLLTHPADGAGGDATTTAGGTPPQNSAHAVLICYSPDRLSAVDAGLGQGSAGSARRSVPV